MTEHVGNAAARNEVIKLIKRRMSTVRWRFHRKPQGRRHEFAASLCGTLLVSAEEVAETHGMSTHDAERAVHDASVDPSVARVLKDMGLKIRYRNAEQRPHRPARCFFMLVKPAP